MMKKEILFMSLLLGSSALTSSTTIDLDASDMAQRVATRAKNAIEESTSWGCYKNFGTWSYQGAMIFRGLWELHSVLDLPQLESFLNAKLDFFQTNENQFGYQILHNESLSLNGSLIFWPWILSIGDNIGLFPIVFGDRQRHASNPDLTASEDLYIIQETVTRYIDGYPWHLKDGTISRPYSWPSEGLLELTGQALWVDDILMGTLLKSELAYHTLNQSYALQAASDILKLQFYLVDKDVFVLRHGYNHRTGHQSCCRWARGNGWALMGTADALSSLELFPDLKSSQIYLTLLENFRWHATNLTTFQNSNDGRWHNILDDPESFLETSSTAMYLHSFIKGVQNGWLSSEEFEPIIDQSWKGLKKAMDFDGTIHGIIGETAIKDEAEEYEPTSTKYCDAAPGLGVVLRAIAALLGYI